VKKPALSCLNRLFTNSSVFSNCLKSGKDVEERITFGKPFQTLVAAAENGSTSCPGSDQRGGQ